MWRFLYQEQVRKQKEKQDHHLSASLQTRSSVHLTVTGLATLCGLDLADDCFVERREDAAHYGRLAYTAIKIPSNLAAIRCREMVFLGCEWRS